MLSRRQMLLGGLAAVGALGFWSRSSASSGNAAPPAAAPTPMGLRPTGSTMPPTTPTSTSTIVAPTTTVVPFAALDHDLVEGMVGDDVRAMQDVLASLRFDPGPIDGIFGGATLRSVWAFEKLALGTSRSDMRGIVTPDIWERMNDDLTIEPRRSPGGTHMEVYLPEQVSVLYVDGDTRVISHVSAGEDITWCDEVEIDLDDGTTELKGICGRSVTPGGVYHFERKVDGWRNAKLGRLYQPIYFNYGIAIHGSGNVPSYPASRGCVRHPMHIAEYLPDLIEIGDMIYVFDGVEEPENYGAQPMIFDWPDPDWVPPTTTTTTTTSTTTTSTTTTSTTVPPTTTSPTTIPVASTSGVPSTTSHPPSTSTLP